MDTDLLTDLATLVDLDGTTGERSARTVLDAGRPGLDFFCGFGPSYARYTGAEYDFERDFREPYERGVDIELGRLRDDVDRFRTVSSGLDDVSVGMRNRGAPVLESWQGDTAKAAGKTLGSLVADTGELRDRFTKVGEAVGTAADTADRIVYGKASAVGKLAAHDVAGRTAEEVAFLVDVRSGGGDNADLALAASLTGAAPDPATIQSTVDNWLRTEFVPTYQARQAWFRQTCADADQRLAECWATLSRALGGKQDAAPMTLLASGEPGPELADPNGDATGVGTADTDLARGADRLATTDHAPGTSPVAGTYAQGVDPVPGTDPSYRTDPAHHQSTPRTDPAGTVPTHRPATRPDHASTPTHAAPRYGGSATGPGPSPRSGSRSAGRGGSARERLRPGAQYGAVAGEQVGRAAPPSGSPATASTGGSGGRGGGFYGGGMPLHGAGAAGSADHERRSALPMDGLDFDVPERFVVPVIGEHSARIWHEDDNDDATTGNQG